MREVAWIKAALKDFGDFPKPVQARMADALAIAAIGQKADIAKPLKGLGAGVFEIALPYALMPTGPSMRCSWVTRSG